MEALKIMYRELRKGSLEKSLHKLRIKELTSEVSRKNERKYSKFINKEKRLQEKIKYFETKLLN